MDEQVLKAIVDYELGGLLIEKVKILRGNGRTASFEFIPREWREYRKIVGSGDTREDVYMIFFKVHFSAIPELIEREYQEVLPGVFEKQVPLISVTLNGDNTVYTHLLETTISFRAKVSTNLGAGDIDDIINIPE